MLNEAMLLVLTVNSERCILSFSNYCVVLPMFCVWICNGASDMHMVSSSDKLHVGSGAIILICLYLPPLSKWWSSVVLQVLP